MKLFFGWLRWVFSGLEFWKWCFLAGFALSATSWLWPSPYDLWTSGTAMVIFLGWMIKWAVVDTFRDSWQKYKASRNQLLDTIKNSDR